MCKTCLAHNEPFEAAGDWKPWDDDEDFQLSDRISLKIVRPPCEFCIHWYPSIEAKKGEVRGIVCCTADRMHTDFSCYVKVDKTNETDP